MQVPQLDQKGKSKLDECIESVEHRVKLQHILERSDAVRQLFMEFQQVLELLHRAAVTFQQYPLRLTNLDVEDVDDVGPKALAEIIKAISKTSTRYQ